MKNSYLIAGFVVVAAVAAFLFANRNKTEAPINQGLNENEPESESVLNFNDGNYALDTSSSVIYWEGEYLSGLKEEGTVKIKSGGVSVENGLPSSGEFVIDMNTIESIPHKDKLVSHLKSEDFFEVENYSESKFVLKSITPSSEAGAREGRFVISGDLTVKGITKPISFTANMTSDGEYLYATSSFAINRADWNIKYNSATFFSDLGDKIIRDAVVIGLDLKAKKVIE